ncbi:Crp/Fnr family transcriptional regulator [Sphingomonas sp. RS2018]
MLPHLSRATILRGVSLTVGAHAGQVWFPETLLAIVTERTGTGAIVNVGMIGREGMIGWPALLGDGHDSHGASALLDGGDALSIDAMVLRDLCDRHPSLRALMMTFVQTMTVQMAQSVASGLCDGVDARLARLLLMLHDRIDGDSMGITHVELSATLSVRRASVTDCLHVMEGDGIVRCVRGRLAIRDRAGLRAIAGGSYGVAEDAHARLLGAFAKD